MNPTYENKNQDTTPEINESSGKLALNIPLFTIESYGVQLPISLSYNYSGYKVTDIASWVGKGWSISGIGSLSRNVNGFPDDKAINTAGIPGGEYEGGVLRNGRSFTGSWTSAEEKDIAASRIDFQPDVYNYSGLGIHGSFTVKRSESSPQWADILELPISGNIIQSYKSVANNRFDRFEITSMQGVLYSYDKVEFSKIKEGQYGCSPADNLPEQYQNPSYTGQFVSNWLLGSIENPMHEELFSFEYFTPSLYAYKMPNARVKQISLTNPNQFEYDGCTDIYEYHKREIQRINFHGGYVEFVLNDTQRNDLPDAYALKEIYVYKYNEQIPELTRRIAFNYDSFNCCESGTTKSLKLTSVSFYKGQNSLLKTIEFNYSENPNLTTYDMHDLTVAKDYWGFVNDATTNAFAVPNIGIPLGSLNANTQMEPNKAYMDYGALIHIENTTTGSSTHVIYGTNDFSSYGNGNLVSTTKYPSGVRKGPGLRVDGLIISDGNGNSYMKRYFYRLFNDLTHSSGKLVDKPRYFINWQDNDSPLSIVDISSHAVNEGSFSGEPPVVYTNVETRTCKQDQSGNYNCNTVPDRGRTLRWYSFSPNEGNISKPFLPLYRPYWLRGNLLREVQLNAAGDSIHKKILTYDRTITSNDVQVTKLALFDRDIYIDIFPYIEKIEERVLGSTTWHEEKFKLYRTEEINIDPEQPNAANTVQTNYFYTNPNTIAPSRIEINYDDGTTYNTRTKFLSDYILPTQNGLQLEVLAIMKWNSNQIANLYFPDLPVEKYTTIKKLNGPEYLINSEISIYDLVSNYRAPLLKYKMSSALDNPIPLSEYDLSHLEEESIQGYYQNTFHYDQDIFTTKDFENTQFDFAHQPIETVNQYDDFQAIIESPEQKRIIAKITNGRLATSRYTSFEDPGYNGGWHYDETNVVAATSSNKAITGDFYYNLGDVNGNDGDFQSATGAVNPALPAGKYLLSYWSKGNVSTFYNNNGQELDQAGLTENGWAYTEKVIEWENTEDNFITLSGDGFIDELRLHEIDATMETKGYYPDGKVKYDASATGDVVTYAYDNKNRLEWVLDRERNVIEHHAYVEKDIADEDSYNKHITLTARKEGLSKTDFQAEDHDDVRKHVEFMDGLGRFRQSIDYHATNNNKDKVAFAEYGPFGRALKKHLPYYKFLQGSEDYIQDAETQQETYYLNPDDPNEVNTAPYTETELEKSPLQRPVQQGGLGAELQLDNGHTTHIEYGWNTNDDQIWSWGYHPSGAAQAQYLYPPNTLRKKTVTDPDGKVYSTFTDARGRKVATTVEADLRQGPDGRAYTGTAAGTDNIVPKKVTSYTVYDDFNRVVFEIPAKAMEELSMAGPNNTADYFVRTYNHEEYNTGPIVKALVTIYSYDEKGRATQKRVPGNGRQKMVYDHYDRTVMNRDEQNIADGIWNFVKYDTRGRVVLKGTGSISGGRTFHSDEAADHYDADGEIIKGEQFTATGPLMGYTNATYPDMVSENQLTNVYYFDTYDFDYPSEFDFIPFNGISTPMAVTRGLATGSKTRVLNADGTLGGWLTTVTWYDDKKRPVQAFTQNHKGGRDRIDTYYNEYGQVEKTIQYHRYDATADPHVFKTRFTYYNSNGQLHKTYCKLDNDPEILVSTRWYNEKGQLKDLKLHRKTDVDNYMQSIDYRYNDQGRLTHINNTALIVDAFNSEDSDVFGQELTYFDESPEYYMPGGVPSSDDPYAVKPQYSGNISSMMWNAKTPDEDGTLLSRNAYVYRYDDLGNMTEARYASDQPSNPGTFDIAKDFYSEDVSYDLGGNIKHLTRNRNATVATFPNPTVMDDLSYTYTENGYRPAAINDTGEGSYIPQFKHFVDAANQPTEYQYDASGRMTEDLNKNIKMRYNALGLPRTVWQPSNPSYSIEYLYDAAGNKLQKRFIRDVSHPQPHSEIVDKDYMGNFVYENGELKMIYHPEGVIRPTPANADNETAYVYDYFIKDYLGNVRVVLTEENATYTEKFLATMEEVYRQIEEDNFDGINETAEDLPSGYPLDGSVEFNAKIAELSETTGTEIGPSIVLPVRRGDKVSLSTRYFYKEVGENTTYDNVSLLVNEILMSLATSGAGVLRLNEGQLVDIAAGSGNYANAILNLLSNSFDTTNVSKPHSYMVWMLYDNNMKLVPEGSGALRVADPNELGTLIEEEIPALTDGYLHCFVSNEGVAPVNFDNFQVTYLQGKTRQINHYYPYGLSISGIGGDYDDYLNKYTGKELQTGEFGSASLSSGLEMFDFHARFYDPQLGRWFTPDPAEQFHNPYLAMGNNPVMYVDPDGEFIFTAILIGAAIGGLINVGIQSYNGNINYQESGWGWDLAASFGIGAAAGAVAVAVPQAIGTFAGIGLTTAGGGVAAGFVPGAIAGASGGFVSGFGNSLYFDYDNDKTVLGNLGSSSVDGLIGAGIGGVTGGLIGGISAKFQGKPFLGEKAANMDHFIQTPKMSKDGKWNWDKSRWKNMYDPASGFKTVQLQYNQGDDLTKAFNVLAKDITDPGATGKNFLVGNKTPAEIQNFVTNGTGGKVWPDGAGFNFQSSSTQNFVGYARSASSGKTSIILQRLIPETGKFSNQNYFYKLRWDEIFKFK